MMRNREIAGIFKLTADLLELHGENSFKAKSYQNAAFRMEKQDIQLGSASLEEMEKIEGIGKSLAQKIKELQDTGNMQELNRLVAMTPAGLIEMLKIKG